MTSAFAQTVRTPSGLILVLALTPEQSTRAIETDIHTGARFNPTMCTVSLEPSRVPGGPDGPHFCFTAAPTATDMYAGVQRPLDQLPDFLPAAAVAEVQAEIRNPNSTLAGPGPGPGPGPVADLDAYRARRGTSRPSRSLR